jgi:AmpD protein
LRVDAATGWLDGARCVPSPNFDARPRGATLDLIVVHGISLPPGNFGGGWIDQLFCNALPRQAHPYFDSIRDMRVSAHLLIDRKGRVTQYVPFKARAWHAGRSLYCGRSACNDFSIGIELEGTDHVAYSAAQYVVLARSIRALRAGYRSLRRAQIVGHSDIAPGRKTDPGPAFDWSRLRRLLRGAARR